MEEWLRIYLLVFLCVFFLLVFVVPTIRTYKLTGRNPITFSTKDNAHDFVGIVFSACLILTLGMVAVHAFSDYLYQFLVPVPYLVKFPCFLSGFILSHAALLWIILAQVQMGKSWRIGIDSANTGTLVTKGIFGISRNPVFLGVLVATLGIFLVMPNMISCTLFVVIFVTLQVQVRLEEEFLFTQPGYAEYFKKVRRWL